MPRGAQLEEYFFNPDVSKPIEQIYADFDSYTHEFLIGQYGAAKNGWFKVVLPPLSLNGHFLKGLCFSPATDLLVESIPAMSRLFNTLAISMALSYPWSTKADGYLVSYHNPARNQWFRRTASPERRDKILIPMADADYTNEVTLKPVPNATRCVDVLVVSMAWPQKNIPLIVEAVKIYSKKYRPINMLLLIGRPLEAFKPHELEHFEEVKGLFSENPDQFELEMSVIPGLMNQFYSRAKVCVLGSLFEGSNRSILESMACDTPVVCFNKYNWHARAGASLFPEGGGVLAEYGAEPLADAIHKVLAKQVILSPREAFLSRWGRMKFFNECLDALPYYRENLPGFKAGAHDKNEWIINALQANYQTDLHSVLYGEAESTLPVGLENATQVIGNFAAVIGGVSNV